MKKLLTVIAFLVSPFLLFAPIAFAIDREVPIVQVSPRGVVKINSQVLGVSLIKDGSETETSETTIGKSETSEASSTSGKTTSSETEDETAEVEDDSGIQEIDLEEDNGQALIKTKTATGSATRKAESEKLLVNVQAGDKKNDIKIRLSGHQFVLEQGGFETRTGFSLKVDPDTNTITVVTPKGDVLMKTLPVEAINSLLKAQTINRETEAEIVENDTGKSGSNAIFKITGERDAKLFALIPMKFEIVSDIDLTTGATLKTNLPLVLRFLGFLFSH